MLINSIKKKLIISIFIVFLSVQAVSVFIQYYYERSAFISTMEKQSSIVASNFFPSIAKSLEAIESISDKREFLDFSAQIKAQIEFPLILARTDFLENIYFVNISGELIAADNLGGDNSIKNQKLIRNQSLNSVYVGDQLLVFVPFYVNDNYLGGLVFYYSKASVDQVIQKLISRTLILLVLYLVVGFVISLIMASAVTKPIKQLTKASSRMARGEFGERIEVKSNDEIGIFAQTFETMREAIAENEISLRNLHNYLANIINSMPSVLVGVDKNGMVTIWNMQAEKQTGMDISHAIGKPLEDVYPDLIDEMDRIKESIRSSTVLRDPKRIRVVEGETIYEAVTIYPLITDGIEGVVIRVDDITEQIRIEELMVQTEKMMSVGGLAAGMAHEINNPLAAIIQGAENVERRFSVDLGGNLDVSKRLGFDLELVNQYMKERDIDDFLIGIKQAGIRAAEIVRNMLNFARKSETMLKPENINELLDTVLDIASHDHGHNEKYDFRKIKIVKSYESEPLTVKCIKTEIQQVILNLLKNGAEIMSDKYYAGVLDNEGQPSGEGDRYTPIFNIRTYRNNDFACIEIEDNGPGMDEDTRKRVFEPFFTTKAVGKGTGLGLSVSYFIITQNHNGKMGVESAPDEGAKFVIELPATEIREND